MVEYITQANVTRTYLAHAARGADVMIVDPPYSPKVHAKAVSARTGGAGVRARDFGFGHLSHSLMTRIASYAVQVRRWSVVFTDVESVHLWVAAMQLRGAEYVRTIPWVRWSQPQVSGDRPGTGAEMVCLFHAPREKGVRMRWNGPGGRIAYRSEDVDPTPLARAEYTAKSLRGNKYSCEKPLDLMLALVSDYSDPGDLIFDPCAGVGTTGVAARVLGREFYGFEMRQEIAEAADLRVGEVSEETLPARDFERIERWATETYETVVSVKKPTKKSEVKTWERAQRRFRDVRMVADLESEGELL